MRGGISNECLTQSVLRENVVENSVGGEFQAIFAAQISVEHFQLSLALIEFLVITLLHGNAGMRLIDLGGEFVANTLDLLDEMRKSE